MLLELRPQLPAVVAAAVAAEAPEGGIRKELRKLLVILLLFVPAFLDIGLAAADFFIFTATAKEESDQLLASISTRSQAWCVTVTDECMPLFSEAIGPAPEPLPTIDVMSASALIIASLSRRAGRFLPPPSFPHGRLRGRGRC